MNRLCVAGAEEENKCATISRVTQRETCPQETRQRRSVAPSSDQQEGGNLSVTCWCACIQPPTDLLWARTFSCERRTEMRRICHLDRQQRGLSFPSA